MPPTFRKYLQVFQSTKNAQIRTTLVPDSNFLSGLCLTLKYNEFVSYIEGIKFNKIGLSNPDDNNIFIDNNNKFQDILENNYHRYNSENSKENDNNNKELIETNNLLSKYVDTNVRNNKQFN